MKKYVPYRHRLRCLECGSLIDQARSNQKFCSDSCRNRWHYKEHMVVQRYSMRVISALDKNHNILMDLIEAGENSVEINYLESLGFNPKFCTGYCKRWGYGEYQCFDIRYREKGGIIYDMSSILDRAAQ